MTITLMNGHMLYCDNLSKAGQLKMINARDPSEYFYRKIAPNYRVCVYHPKRDTPPSVDGGGVVEAAAAAFHKIKTEGDTQHGA